MKKKYEYTKEINSEEDVKNVIYDSIMAAISTMKKKEIAKGQVEFELMGVQVVVHLNYPKQGRDS